MPAQSYVWEKLGCSRFVKILYGFCDMSRSEQQMDTLIPAPERIVTISHTT